MTKLAVAIAFAALNFYTYHYLATQEVTPERTSFASFPRALGDWSCPAPDQMPADVIRNLGVTDYLSCAFRRESTGEQVGVYVGYHTTQVRKEGGGANENMIHPPAHCLPGSGWDIIASGRVALEVPGLPGAPAQVNRLVIAKGEARQLVYYWYQERGRVIAQDWRKIVDLFWDRATRGRTDGALIRFTVPLERGREETAERALLANAGEIVPLLPAFVPN